MKIAECTSCGSKFDVTPYKPGSKLRCAKCKGVFVVPDVATAPTAATPAAMAAPAPAGKKKSAEDSFFPEDSEAPQHDWQVAPKEEGEEHAPASKPKVTKQPTRAFQKPAATREPASGGGGSTGGTRRFSKPTADVPSTGRGAATRGERAGGRAGGRGEGGGRKAPAKGSNTMLIMLGSVGAMVLSVGLLIFAFSDNKKAGTGSGGSGGSGGTGEKPPAEDFASKKAKTNLGSISEVLALADWCDKKSLTKERDELMEVAYKLDPKAMTEKFRALAMSRLQLLPLDDANAHFQLAEWCDAHGLSGEAERLTDKALKINPNHAGANKRRGLVLYEGKWELKEMVDILAAKQKAYKDEAELLAGMTERGRDVYKRKKELKAEFSEQGGWPDIEFLDAKPYLLCLQKSKKYASDLRLSDFSEITNHLFTAFYKMYAEKFELTDMKESVVIIFVFEDREGYMKYGQTIGIPPYAGGHYEQGGKKRLMIYNDVSDPYETIFHEGMHQLVDFATMSKGKKDKNMFWFTEGVATYFENFRRDPKEGFILGEVSTGKYLPTIKEALRLKMGIPLEKLIGREYSEVVQEAMQDKTGRKIGIYYAESWALTHFFYKAEGGKYKEKFEEYFKKEIYGQGGVAAFKEVFGDPATLQEEWIKYVKELK